MIFFIHFNPGIVGEPSFSDTVEVETKPLQEKI